MSKTIREAIDNYSGNTTHSNTIREAIDNAAGHKGLKCSFVSCLGVDITVTGSFSGWIPGSAFTFSPKSKTAGELKGDGTLVDIVCFPVGGETNSVKFAVVDIGWIRYKKPNDETEYKTPKRQFISHIDDSFSDVTITAIEGLGVCDADNISAAVSFNAPVFFKLLST